MSARGGIDLGGTKIQAIIVDDDHEVIGQARRPTPTSGGPREVAVAIAGALREAATSANVEAGDLDGVGIGSPGGIDADTGTVSHAKNLPDWDGSFGLGPVLADDLGVPVKLGNDVQTATDAEVALGAAKPYDSVLGVFWGTGVGGGIIINGKPWLGRGAAAEVGHVCIRVGGRRCGCGRKGCMEAYAGRASMEKRARKLSEKKGKKTSLFAIMEERGRDRLTSGIWWRAIKHGDKVATTLIDDAIDALGAGIASACNVLDVQAVIIGGGLGVRFGEPYVRRIEAAMMPHLFSSDKPPDIHLAALGDLGGAIGASLLVEQAPRRAGGGSERKGRRASGTRAKAASSRSKSTASRSKSTASRSKSTASRSKASSSRSKAADAKPATAKRATRAGSKSTRARSGAGARSTRATGGRKPSTGTGGDAASKSE